MLGAFFEGGFFVFDDDFVVGDFDDFFARDKKLSVEDALDEGAFDDDLLDKEIIGVDGVIDDLTEFAAFFSFDFESEKIEIES